MDDFQTVKIPRQLRSGHMVYRSVAGIELYLPDKLHINRTTFLKMNVCTNRDRL